MNSYKEIPGTEGVYFAHANGIIYRVKGRSGQMLKSIRPLETKKNRHGKDVVRLRVDGKLVTRTVVVIIAKLFIPNPGGKPYVKYKDGDLSNNRSDNLEWIGPIIPLGTRPVSGFMDWYHVSASGKVFSTSRNVLSELKGGVDLLTGERKMTLYGTDKKPKTIGLGELVASVFLAPVGDLRHVRCKDGNQENCAFDNLEFITDQEHAQNIFTLRATTSNELVPFIKTIMDLSKTHTSAEEIAKLLRRPEK